MAKLEPLEKRKLEKLFGMGSGYVLDFSNRTFSEFFSDTLDINIDDDKYDYQSNSKANRLRKFWDVEPDEVVGKSIIKMIELWEDEILLNNKSINENEKVLSNHCIKIAKKLMSNTDSIGNLDENSFLQKDYTEIDIKKFNVSQNMTSVIEQRLEEIQICLKNNAPLASIFLIGSLLEGMLIDLANRNIKNFNKAKSSPKRDGKALGFNDWRLNSLIDVAYELDIIGIDVKKHSHSLKDFRNYIHPAEQVKSNFKPDKHTSAICWQVLKAAMHDITQSKGEGK